MSTQMLLMAALVSMTVVAIMIAINSRGRWRATISSLLAICLLGGTAWVFILQYSIIAGADRQGGGPLAVFKSMLQGKDPAPSAPAQTEPASDPAAMSYIITRINDFTDALLQERLHDPIFSHEQLVARANSTERRFETLQSEVKDKKHLLDSIPGTALLLDQAMTELKAACHLYNAYYFAENTDAEMSIERLFRQRARSARDTLLKAEKTLNRKP